MRGCRAFPGSRGYTGLRRPQNTPTLATRPTARPFRAGATIRRLRGAKHALWAASARLKRSSPPPGRDDATGGRETCCRARAGALAAAGWVGGRSVSGPCTERPPTPPRKLRCGVTLRGWAPPCWFHAAPQLALSAPERGRGQNALHPPRRRRQSLPRALGGRCGREKGGRGPSRLCL